ncbi:MAG: hypothetical protein CMJ18_04945 [Phycisphaeraceae bacterium]|nr:hypothetical protein [Phycisphaeraceae bacterium]
MSYLPNIEPLEPRLLLSATLRGATLRIIGTPDNDLITVEAGTQPGDVVVHDATDNGPHLFAGVKRLRIVTRDGNDDVRLADDLIAADGSALRAVIRAGRGDDTVQGGGGGDRIIGGRGDDVLHGGGGDDVVRGQRGRDELDGGEGDDRLRGGTGDDMILGDDGDDRMFGGRGDDTLNGGEGINRFRGGRGRDIYYAHPDVDLLRLSRRDQLVHDRGPDTLRRLENEDALRRWLIDLGLEQWDALTGQRPLPGNWLLGGPIEVVDTGIAVRSFSADAQLGVALAEDGAGTDFSQTNVQVAGVDEADLVKTDGEHIYIVSHDELIIVDADPDNLEVVARAGFDGFASGLYLMEDRAVVLAADHGYAQVRPFAGDAFFAPTFEPAVTVTVFDVSDPTAPDMVRETRVDGSLTTSRAADGHVYAVVSNPFQLIQPVIDGGPVLRGAPETPAEYEQRIDALDLDAVLPTYTTTTTGDEGGTTTGSLVAAPNVYVPRIPAYRNMTTIVAFDITGPEPGAMSTSSVVGIASEAFASTGSIYLVNSIWWSPDRAGGQQSKIHKFDYDGLDVTLEATGTVPGTTLNQFSLDEHDGLLRVATTNWDGDFENNVFVLEQDDDELEIVGSLVGLAKTERIESVRFLGDVGYVVTFRRVDPLFTIDLRDAENPSVLGELKVPGFSTFLHPLGDTHLIGLGRDADEETGRADRMQLSLFDVTELTDPQLQGRYLFDTEGHGFSDALHDHHAFSHFPRFDVVAIPVSDRFWNAGADDLGLEVFEVTPEGGIEHLGKVEHEDVVLRSLVIDENLYSLSRTELIVTEVDDPDEVAGELSY